MQQLSGTDHVSLFSERRTVYNHVATLCIYDVSSAPGGKVRFKDILPHCEECLCLYPRDDQPTIKPQQSRPSGAHLVGIAQLTQAHPALEKAEAGAKMSTVIRCALKQMLEMKNEYCRCQARSYRCSRAP